MDWVWRVCRRVLVPGVTTSGWVDKFNMDGLSAGEWTGSDFVPAEPVVPAAVPAYRDTCPAWLTAMPYAAALVGWRDGAARFEQWNQLFTRLFNGLIEPAQQEVHGWVTAFHGELASFVISGYAAHHFEIERMTPLGIEAFTCSLAWVKGENACDDRILVCAVDRTSDRRVEESLRRELVSDTLTALPNRIGFGEAIETLLERSGLPDDSWVSVLIIDLMRFSRINEALGTMAGDELILAVAARLNASVGRGVTLARIGGNEFGICQVAPQGIADVLTLADRVKAAISSPIRLANLEISINCAIGCSLSRAAESEADELIRQAQTAARNAKKTDRLEIYRAGELGAARQRFMLESRLRDALASGNLHLQYQPIIELSSENVIGLEALSRWNDADLGFVSPNDFIPVAEESGLIVQLGRWAVNEALQQLARWDGHHGDQVPLKINVNLSPIQMVRDDVTSMVREALRLSGVSGQRLSMEVTESALVADPDACRHLLESLKQLEISIAMDDFGTGYSNMSSLQKLPIDVLKIDRSFVSDMLVDQDKLAIIGAILSLSKTLGMKTTAEGIEDGEVAAKLCEMGCTYGQGYYFAKPMSADDAYQFWLSRRNSAA